MSVEAPSGGGYFGQEISRINLPGGGYVAYNNGYLIVDTNLSVRMKNISIRGDVRMIGNLDIKGDITFEGNINHTGNLVRTGTTTLTGPLNVAGTVTVTDGNVYLN